jgi:hypothetical protein
VELREDLRARRIRRGRRNSHASNAGKSGGGRRSGKAGRRGKGRALASRTHQGYDFAEAQRFAFAELHWTPDIFWSSTPKELNLARQGSYQRTDRERHETAHWTSLQLSAATGEKITGPQLLGEEDAIEDKAERQAEAERKAKALLRKMRKAGLLPAKKGKR